MSRLAFFDTNILLYAYDRSSPAKQDRAIRLIAEHQRQRALVISLQVMQEFFAAATRKLRIGSEEAQRQVEILARGRVVRFVPEDVIAAIELHRVTKISFWDAMIVHAARLAGAAVLYSEDLQPGATIGGVPILDPFAAG